MIRNRGFLSEKDLLEYMQKHVELYQYWDGRDYYSNKYQIRETDVEMKYSVNNNNGLVRDLIFITWAGGWGHKQSSLIIDYCSYDSDIMTNLLTLPGEQLDYTKKVPMTTLDEVFDVIKKFMIMTTPSLKRVFSLNSIIDG